MRSGVGSMGLYPFREAGVAPARERSPFPFKVDQIGQPRPILNAPIVNTEVSKQANLPSIPADRGDRP